MNGGVENGHEQGHSWHTMVNTMFHELKAYLTQEEMQQLVDDLTVMIYKDKKRNEDSI